MGWRRSSSRPWPQHPVSRWLAHRSFPFKKKKKKQKQPVKTQKLNNSEPFWLNTTLTLNL
ncbi:hypothetical protein Hanom_Chr16g01488141 [Helianthus anomalus]